MTGLTFSGDGLLQRFSNQLGELGARAPVALARALNHTGAKAKTAVIRSVEAHLARTRIREILAAEGVVIADGEELSFNQARTAEKIVQTWERDRAHAEAAGRMIDAGAAERRWADEMVKLRLGSSPSRARSP